MAGISFTSPYIPNITLRSTDSWLLAKRSCMAASANVVADIDRMGIEVWLDQQLNPAGISNTEYETERNILFPSFLRMTDAEYFAKYPQHDEWRTNTHLQHAEFHANWRSKRQVEQMMITFWSDQVSYDMNFSSKSNHDALKAYTDHALGKFRDLLIGLYSNQSIVDYLDNYANNKWGLNENLGRELLELHTVGVAAGYTQDDVINSARILTGYKGTAGYRANEHYIGAVKVMGFTHPNTSTNASEMKKMLNAYLGYLAMHPSTARHIADRLVMKFVSDTAKPALASRLASIYLANDSDIRPVLKALFTSSEFKASGGQKIRRPAEVLASLLAAADIRPKTDKPTDFSVTPLMLSWEGHYRGPFWFGGYLPHYNPSPDGYPLDSKKWLSSNHMLSIWDMHRFTDPVHDTRANTTWDARLGVVAGKTTLGAGVKSAAEKVSGIAIDTDTALEKSMRTYAGNSPWSGAQTLPAASKVMDANMIKRLPKAVMLSPLALIS